MKKSTGLGIDIGGTGIKAGLIDIRTGDLISERYKVLTPKPSSPEIIAKEVKKVVDHFKWEGSVGIGFPAVIQNGVVRTASNISKSWIGVDGEKLFAKATGLPTVLMNDADAAGVAEMEFGAGRKKNKGTVVLITIGTGLGSALFRNGQLVPNTEFGHLIMHGDIAEKYASNAARENNELSFPVWGKRLNEYLDHLHFLLRMERIILGGGVSKYFEEYKAFLKVSSKVKVRSAKLKNNAGIAGVAHAAFNKNK